MKMIEQICEICGKKYSAKPADAMKRKAGGRYCSDECCWESMRKPENYKICQVCGKQFYAKGGRKKHCSRECSDKNRTPWGIVEVQCEICEKQFVVHKSDIARGRGKYCSRECMAKGQKNGEMVNCTFCGEAFYAPGHKFERYQNLYCSKECAAEGQKAGEVRECECCGKEFYVPQCILDRRAAMYCSPVCVMRSRGKATSIEIATADALECFGIDFIQQWSPEGYNRIYDFKAGCITIEVNGDYWHNLPGAAKVDQEKEEWARENGLIPVTLWEHEIWSKGAKNLIKKRVLPFLDLEAVAV